jgi:hypothetical protein
LHGLVEFGAVHGAQRAARPVGLVVNQRCPSVKRCMMASVSSLT